MWSSAPSWTEGGRSNSLNSLSGPGIDTDFRADAFGRSGQVDQAEDFDTERLEMPKVFRDGGQLPRTRNPRDRDIGETGISPDRVSGVCDPAAVIGRLGVERQDAIREARPQVRDPIVEKIRPARLSLATQLADPAPQFSQGDRRQEQSVLRRTQLLGNAHVERRAAGANWESDEVSMR